MYSFKNDYAEGAHPLVLKALAESNFSQEAGYGEDTYTLLAKQKIRQQIDHQDAAIYLVAGGTLANLLVISYLLRPHEAVISAASGHIQANETGAIEQTGHRIITVEGKEGKVLPGDLHEVMERHRLRPHVVRPRMVYISNATEWGTIYSLQELKDLYQTCQDLGLWLFMDGARLGQALASDVNDVQWKDLAQFTDVFYIGGTKNGALLGEAIVFNSPDICQDFDYHLKQRGALMAKGRVLGVQFKTLFESDLYDSLALHANHQASRMAKAIVAQGFQFWMPPHTNQLFPIFPNELIEHLSGAFSFYVWKKIDEHHTVVRLITSWATPDHAVEQWIKAIKVSFHV